MRVCVAEVSPTKHQASPFNYEQTGVSSVKAQSLSWRLGCWIRSASPQFAPRILLLSNAPWHPSHAHESVAQQLRCRCCSRVAPVGAPLAKKCEGLSNSTAHSFPLLFLSPAFTSRWVRMRSTSSFFLPLILSPRSLQTTFISDTLRVCGTTDPVSFSLLIRHVGAVLGDSSLYELSLSRARSLFLSLARARSLSLISPA